MYSVDFDNSAADFVAAPHFAQESADIISYQGACMCTACGLKTVVSDTPFCSRRCSWAADGKCPQCGRFRDAANPYCSGGCCNQALQANWCPCCGICQISSSGSCTNVHCEGANMVFCGESRKRQRMHHSVLPVNDPARGTLQGSFNAGFSAGYGNRIHQIIRINTPQVQKKRYLSYRSTVESTIASLGCFKYGHGGEGNEQRRFFPLNLRCGLGGVAAAGFLGSNNIHCCGNSDCSACRVLLNGLRLTDSCEASHYCTTTAFQSMMWCPPNAVNLRAMLVARVVVGNPELVLVQDEAEPQPQISLPQDPDMVHCTIVTNEDPSQDGTYLFRDDAIDPMFLVIFE